VSRKWQKHIKEARELVAQGQHLEAERAFLTAAREIENSPKQTVKLAETWHELGVLMTVIGSFDEAEGYLLRALKIREESHGPVHKEVAETLTALGKIYAPYESEESEKLLQRAITIYQELDDSTVVFPTEMLSTLYLLRGRREERRLLLSALVEKMESKKGAKSPLTGKALFMLAQFHDESDDAEAERLLTRALPLLTSDDIHAQSAAEAALLLAKIQFRKNKFAESETNFKLALDKADLVPQTSAHTTVEILSRLAKLYCVAYRKYSGAEQLLARASAICQAQVPPLPTHNVILEYDRLCEFTGNYETLEKLRRDLLEAFKSIVDDARDRCETGERLAYASTESCNLSRLLRQQNRLDEAEEYAQWAVETDEAHNSPKLVASLIELASVRFAQEKADEAAFLVDRVLQLKFDQNWYFPQLADALRLVTVMGRKVDASNLERIVRGFIEKFSGNHEWCKGLCHRLALVFYEVDRTEDADELSARALKEAQQAESTDTLLFAYLLETWAAQIRLAGAADRSKAYEERAGKIRDAISASTSLPVG